jgi:hypothetical protein
MELLGGVLNHIQIDELNLHETGIGYEGIELLLSTLDA